MPASAVLMIATALEIGPNLASALAVIALCAFLSVYFWSIKRN